MSNENARVSVEICKLCKGFPRVGVNALSCCGIMITGPAMCAVSAKWNKVQRALASAEIAGASLEVATPRLPQSATHRCNRTGLAYTSMAGQWMVFNGSYWVSSDISDIEIKKLEPLEVSQ